MTDWILLAFVTAVKSTAAPMGKTLNTMKLAWKVARPASSQVGSDVSSVPGMSLGHSTAAATNTGRQHHASP